MFQLYKNIQTDFLGQIFLELFEFKSRSLFWDTPYLVILYSNIKGAVASADLKISKSALLSLNHHNFSNTKPIYTE